MVRVIFFGTPAFAVPTLEGLIRSSHEVLAVVTQPDRKRGRGQRIGILPVKDAALKYNLPVMQPEKIDDEDFISKVEGFKPDIAVVAAYGKLIPNRLLALPLKGMVNVHASLLPKYRGAAPVHRAIMAGDQETGITIIRLVQEMDAGPMLGSVSCPITPDDNSETLGRTLSHLGSDLLLSVIDKLAVGEVNSCPQNHKQATFAPRLNRQDGIIDWDKNALEICNQVRGLHPWPYASSYLNGSRYAILQSAVIDHPNPGQLAIPGEIVEVSKNYFVVASGKGTALKVDKLQKEGKRPLNTRAFLAGHRLESGDTFRQSLA